MNAVEVYIVDVELFNFASHNHNIVPFVNGMNALVGPSNSGKSSVLRGIVWCLRNSPAGDDFIRNGEDDCWVKINLSNDVAIKRRRTRSGHVNTYEVFRHGVALFDTPLTGFGTRIPHEVSEACGMEGFEYLFSSQLSAAYLLSESPASRAKTIGGLEELGRVDEELVTINEDIRTNDKMLREINAELQVLEKKRIALEKDIEADMSKIELLRELTTRIRSNEVLLEKVMRASKRVHDIEVEITALTQTIASATRIVAVWKEDLPARVDNARKIELALERLIAIDQELNVITFMNEERLQTMLELIDRTDKNVMRYQRLQIHTQRLGVVETDLVKYAGSYSEKASHLEFSVLDQRIMTFTSLLQRSDRLKEIEAEVKSSQAQIETSRTEIDRLLDEAVSALQEAEMCAECGQSTEHITHEHIKSTIL
jgi:DNA repair exonuclease SbcCD ATPase subunit